MKDQNLPYFRRKIIPLIKVVKSMILGQLHHSEIPTPKQEDLLVINTGSKVSAIPIPKIIWMYWEDGNLPELVQKSVERITRINLGFKVVLLNKDNLSDYLPSFVCESNIPLANKSDLIRLELLYEFGGIWVDSTAIINENFDWVINLSNDNHYDLIGYYREVSTTDKNYPVIESWFLATYPKNSFIKLWLDILRPLGNIGNKAYFDRIQERDDYELIRQKITDPSYLLVYLACQIAMRESSGLNLYLKKCEDCCFLIQESLNWDKYLINYTFCRKPIDGNFYPFIKLTSTDRSMIKEYGMLGLINKNSLIGNLLQNG
ncbi:glycosyltransferase family 32 protein [Sphingobacterium sp. BS-2]|uniref:glycosyltransferase family 32 protein n=1 Tax=Sphingobacterium sp. BS-2 TaxID=3377129 RepID=UPI0038FC0170